MATLTRPGVEISQEIIVESPTILAPALVPCIVGPCYQIVEPLTDVGALNSDAQVKTSAILESTAVVSDPASVSALKLSLSVNGGSATEVTFPTTIGNVGLSHALIENELNKQLESVSAKFVENKLTFTTTGTGGAQRTLLLNAISNDAYTALNLSTLVGTTATGQDDYSNTSYVFPYSSLPSPLASVSEVVFEADELKVYRFFANALTEFSKTKAINLNSYVGGTSKFANVATNRKEQPALGNGKTMLFGTGTGVTTNTVIHIGTEASTVIPLAQKYGKTSTGIWPDASGQNYLKVTAKGYGPQNNSTAQAFTPAPSYLDSQSNNIGNFVGTLGNAITVDIQPMGSGGSGAAELVWNSSTKKLTIQIDSDTTFSTLETAIAAITGYSADDLVVELFYNKGAYASEKVLGTVSAATVWNGIGTKTFYLGGGTDPHNFSADANDGSGLGKATVTGAINLGDGAKPSDLGLGDISLKVSMDGGKFVDISIASSAVIHDTIDAALVAALGGDVDGYCTQVTPTAPFSALSGTVSTVTTGVLQLTSPTAGAHDSTIEIDAADHVIQKLFSGYKTATEAVIADLVTTSPSGYLAGRALQVTGGSSGSFNKQSATAMERALVPGTVTMDFSNVSVCGKIITQTLSTHGEWGNIDGEALQLQMAHSSVASGATKEVNVTVPSLADGEMPLTTLAAAIQTGIDASDLTGKITCSMIDGTFLALAEATGVAGATITLVDPTGLAGTDAGDTAFSRALDNTVGGTAIPNSTFSVFDKAAVTTAASMTIKDSGTDSAIQVTAVTPYQVNGVAATRNVVANSTWTDGFSATSAADLTTHFLESGESEIDYGQCKIDPIVFFGESQEAAAASKQPVSAMGTASTALSITYSRGHAATMSKVAPIYTARIFTGDSDKTVVGDELWDNGKILGRVVAINDTVASGVTHTGASLSISESAVDKESLLTSWYINAAGLVTGGTRLEPEAVMSDLTQKGTIKHGLNRDAAGVPMVGKAPVYTEYKALRKDVTAAAADPKLLVFNTASEVESIIGPIDPKNPLAYALSLAFLQTTNIHLTAIGVSGVTADAPDGTLASYAEALEFLESHEVYALAPLTFEKGVHQKFSKHVTAMSEATSKKERMAIVCSELPTEKEALLVASGEADISDIGGGKFELTFPDTVNFVTALNGLLDANGGSISAGVGVSYGPEIGIFLDREGDGFRFLVTKIAAANVLQIEVNNIYQPGQGPGTGGNGDAYYRSESATTTVAQAAPQDFEADGELCSVFVRQAAISLLTSAGKLKACEALAEIAGGVTGYQNRRLVMIQPEKVITSIGGLDYEVSGFYLCAAIAAMIGQENPSQPFTNFPMVGFSAPKGSSDKFSETQMSTAAAGGIYWVIQDTAGAPLASRHQLTTDVSSLKTRELSILKSVDWTAKLVRNQVKRYIGRKNITRQLLEALSLGLNGSISSAIGQGVIAGGSLDSIKQDPDNLDSVIIQVTISPFYPANRIKITIFV